MKQDLSDSDLFAYSEEHVAHEFDIFFWLTRLLGCCEAYVIQASAEDASRVNNILIEAYVLHLGNLIDFFYPNRLEENDIFAADFLPPGEWEKNVQPISSVLAVARSRANKELAHLTTERLPNKAFWRLWDVNRLAAEIRPLVNLLSEKALPSRFSPVVAAAAIEKEWSAIKEKICIKIPALTKDDIERILHGTRGPTNPSGSIGEDQGKGGEHGTR